MSGEEWGVDMARRDSDFDNLDGSIYIMSKRVSESVDGPGVLNRFPFGDLKKGIY